MHDRVRRCPALGALRLQREVDHHDRVFLHETDEQHDAHERVDAEVDVEDKQREQRAKCRKRQPRKNRDRMNKTLVQDAQHDIDHENRDHEQREQSRLRRLEGLRRPGEARRDRRRQRVARDTLHLVHRVAQRHAGTEIE